MKENLKIIILKEKDATFGKMVENITVIGSIIKCTGKVNSLGLMENPIKVYFLHIYLVLGQYVEDKKDGYGVFEWGDGRKYNG